MSLCLKVDWCSHAAAKFAVENWHYSHSLPAPRRVYIGAWENDRFIGAIVFSRGANNNIGKPYGLEQIEVTELTRVALTTHQTPVSKIVSIAIKMLTKQSPGLRLLVSYADPEQGHVGGIYQAMNWVFVGNTQPDYYLIDKTGKRWHSRMIATSGYKKVYGVQKKTVKPIDGRLIETDGKHKYIYPLDKMMAVQIEPLRKPYPKRAISIQSETPSDQLEEGGAIPTIALKRC